LPLPLPLPLQQVFFSLHHGSRCRCSEIFFFFRLTSFCRVDAETALATGSRSKTAGFSGRTAQGMSLRRKYSTKLAFCQVLASILADLGVNYDIHVLEDSRVVATGQWLEWPITRSAAGTATLDKSVRPSPASGFFAISAKSAQP